MKYYLHKKFVGIRDGIPHFEADAVYTEDELFWFDICTDGPDIVREITAEEYAVYIDLLGLCAECEEERDFGDMYGGENLLMGS